MSLVRLTTLASAAAPSFYFYSVFSWGDQNNISLFGPPAKVMGPDGVTHLGEQFWGFVGGDIWLGEKAAA